MGLHNHERHAPTSVTDMAWCNVCDGPCYSPEACCCCLAAEVEVLREQITCDGVRCAKCEGAVVWCIDRLWRGPKP